MVFLGLTRPTLASRRVATEYGSSRGFNYPAEHVGASRDSPPVPTSPHPSSSSSNSGDINSNDGAAAIAPNSSSDASKNGGGKGGGLRLPAVPYVTDCNFTRVGTGKDDFASAKGFMRRWGHFQLGWSEVDEATGTGRGDNVCVCANVLGVWIRNPLQVVYNEESSGSGGVGQRGRCKERFSFAHGCLEGHLLAGEESFVLERWEDDSVWYGVNTFSRPAHPLACLGYPAVRLLQWRFAQDSMRAVRRGVEEARGGGGGGRGSGGGG